MAENTDNKALQEMLYPDIDDRVGITVIATAILLFFVVNAVILRLSQRVGTLQKTSEWRWRNLTVSWVHAVFCSWGIWYCYTSYRQHIHTLGDLLDLRPYPAYILTAFSTGYFLYDFLEHIVKGEALKQWEVTLHHIAVLYIFGYNLIFHTAVAFSVLALMVEVNSVFLHGRKLLQMVQLPFTHWLYRIVVALNLATFVFFRGAAMVLIWAGLLFNRDRVTSVYFVALSLVMIFMIILNPVLLWRLLKSDIRSRRRRKPGTLAPQKDGGQQVTLNGNSSCATATFAGPAGQRQTRHGVSN